LDSNKVYVVLKEYTGVDHNITHNNVIGVYSSKEIAYKVKSELKAAYNEDYIVIKSNMNENEKKVNLKLNYEIKVDRHWNISINNIYNFEPSEDDIFNKVVFTANNNGINAHICIQFDMISSSYSKEEKKAANIVLKEAKKLFNDIMKLVSKTDIRIDPRMDHGKLQAVYRKFTSDVIVSSQESIKIYNEMLESFGRQLKTIFIDIEEKYFGYLMTPDKLEQVNYEIHNKMCKFDWYDKNSKSLKNGLIEYLMNGNYIFN